MASWLQKTHKGRELRSAKLNGVTRLHESAVPGCPLHVILIRRIITGLLRIETIPKIRSVLPEKMGVDVDLRE